MDTQIWSKIDDKWATILILRGHEVHRLSVNGLSLTLKKKVRGIIEALEQGQTPQEAGVKSVETLDARTIGKAEMSPGNDSLTLRGEGEGGKKMSYSSAGKDADKILAAILGRSERNFQSTQEAIGPIEALIPPALVGVVTGVILAVIHDAARKLQAGQRIEVKGRRRGLQQTMISVADKLGTTGTVKLGVALGILVLSWAAMRIIARPHRTVWLPAETA